MKGEIHFQKRTANYSLASALAHSPPSMSITLRTTLGDIKIEVFCSSVPRTAENFLAVYSLFLYPQLCASGYYNGCKFHRSIPGFMAQTVSYPSLTFHRAIRQILVKAELVSGAVLSLTR
jgi:hypothetical protein